ncbi:MAG: hypothetical protein IJB33_05255 [Akkermansia sp.]|nr:hypothetical protein [Akkermansia sp.]MBQ7023621.1 hypothetical protein [Akkermansia sp.]
MKNYSLIALSAALLGLSSCTWTKDYNSVGANQIGVTQQALPATVIAAQKVTQEASSTAKNLGTGIGAAVGVAGGQLLGKGKGRIVSTVGLGAAGALAGRYLTSSMAGVDSQRLTVRVDGTHETFTFVQNVTDQHGEIPVGCHGTYYHGSNAHFVPDGM